MTRIICSATTCKYNSSIEANDPIPGRCMLEVIKLTITEDDNFNCEMYKNDTNKPFLTNKEYTKRNNNKR